MLYPLPPLPWCSLPAPQTSTAFSESTETWRKMGERKLRSAALQTSTAVAHLPHCPQPNSGAPALNQLRVLSVAPCEMPAHTASCGQATRSGSAPALPGCSWKAARRAASFPTYSSSFYSQRCLTYCPARFSKATPG